MNIFYKIAIDRISANYISGWCFHRFKRQRTIRLECCLDGQVIAESTADLYREDLRELGIHPTGCCGFEMVLPTWQEWSARPGGQGLQIRVKDGGVLAEVSSETLELVGGRQRITRILALRPSRKSVRQMVFMHIPKTAGTSFNTLVQSMIPAGMVTTHIELLDTKQYPAKQKTQGYLSGHLRIGLLKTHLALDGADLYSIVREPYSQLHSHLQWLKATAAKRTDNFFKHNNPTIYHLGLRLAAIDFSDNRALSAFVDNIDDVASAFLDNMQTRYFLDDQPRRVGAAELAQARRNCGLFRLIGLTEEYGDFVEKFCQINALSAPKLPTGRLNRSSATPLYDTGDREIREILYPLVRFDLELYGELRNIWQEPR